MMRYAALSLPRWPIERLKRASADSAARPFVLTLSGAGGDRLYALTPAGEAAGLSQAMGVADARALAPALQARAAAPEADQKALNRLARWCGRFSPWTAPDPGAPGLDGVLLDIQGCAAVFGGEDQLLTRLVRDSRALGLTAFAAAAPTVGLAWALARFSAPTAQRGWVAVQDMRPTVPDLPVEALRIGDVAAKLRRFGLTHIGALQAVPRASLAKRFGLDLVRRLDQMTGQERESLTPLAPQADLRARVRFPEPLETLDSITAAAGDAVARLCEVLDREGLGLTRLRLTLYRVDGQARDLLVGAAAPSRDAAHLHRLLKERLARAHIDIGFGIDLVEAGAALARRLEHAQVDMTGREGGGAEAARLVDRLNARLGRDAVRCPKPVDSHKPERAARWSRRPEMGRAWPTRREQRPLLILERPEPAQAVAEIPDGPPRRFTWRQVRHDVARAEGPERIAPEWWRAPAGAGPGLTRDYFRVETQAGRRFWLYRDGLYASETMQPAWFVHGAG